MMTILYHASANQIDEFQDNINGTHFGSKLSAYQRMSSVLTQDHFYLHRCKIHYQNPCFILSDSGDYWIDEIKECLVDGFDCIVYNNQYEPSTKASMCLWKGNQVKVLDWVKLDRDDLERLIEDEESIEYFI
jgi:hypothetical protein